MIFVVENEKELGDRVWQEIKDKLPNPLRVGLKGDLGAGKTTLVCRIASHLGLKKIITSPTFNLRKLYELSIQGRTLFLQHIDLYRIENASKVDLFEIKEWLDADNCITFVEWINNVPQFKDYLDLLINIEVQGEAKRKVEMTWL